MQKGFKRRLANLFLRCALLSKAAGPMAADPGDLPWKKLSPQTRTRP
jgi:hypothetical protein